MPDQKRRLNTRERVALGVASVIALTAGGAGLVVGVTQAQDAPTAETAALNDGPVAYSDIKAQEAAAATDTGQTQSLTASSRLTNVSQATAVQPTVKTAIPTRQPSFFRPMTQTAPITMRRADAPARVEWRAARESMDQSKSVRKGPTMAARLPQQALNQTRLPVILPREGGVIKTAQSRMHSFGDAYALNMPQDNGMSLTVYGNRSIVKGDPGAVSARPFARLQGVAEDVQITQLEDGWTATFSRFGVVYSVDFLCLPTQAECQNDTFLRQAVADLSDVAMGTEATKEAEEELNPVGSWFNRTVSDVSSAVKGN